MREITTGINWTAVKKEIQRSAWERSHDGDGEERSVFLGTVFALFPSGKYYTPFACSNVETCPNCKGAGSFPAHRKRRIVKKWHARADRQRRKAERLRSQGITEYEEIRKRIGAYISPYGAQCERCGGLGSHEAFADQCYQEALESEASAVGLSIANGEGDSCDIFAIEYREATDGDDTDGDDTDGD